ncbi:MAG: methyltransferase family protein [Deltaproteobacteria bacterium]
MNAGGSKWKSRALVWVQFLCLGVIAASCGIIASGAFYLSMEAAGAALGLWAVRAMGYRFNISPDVPEGGRLATEGPYRFIRHPMYSALLLATLALVLDSLSPFSIAVWCILAANLWIKLRYEEGWLSLRFPDYEAYSRRTRRLIPYLL